MKHLGKITIVSLTIGIAASGLSYALGEYHPWPNFDLGDSFSGASCSYGAGDATPGTKHLSWDGSDTITIAISGRVHYHGGDGDDVVMRGPQNALDHVRVRDGKIEADCRGFGRDLDITLPGSVFQTMTLAGSGRLMLDNLSQSDLKLTIAGSGSVQAQGTVDDIKVTIAGSGSAKLAELKTKRLHLTIAGSGGVEASPQDEAEITIAGSGDVHLLTHPARLKTSVMGSGRVTQADL